jgi:hypothetical protein
MSNRVQQLFVLAAHFESIAIDIPQPPDFDEDYRKYLEMTDPTPKDDEGAYEKWLKDKGTLDQEIPVEKLHADTYIRTANNSIDKLISKYGQSFLSTIKKYQLGSPHIQSRGMDLLNDLIESLKINAYHKWEQSEKTEKDQRVKDILLKQAELFGNIVSEMETLDQALNQVDDNSDIVQ